MDPEPERSLEKLASRREAKDEGGSVGSNAAMLCFISCALSVAVTALCASGVLNADFNVKVEDEEGIGSAERGEDELCKGAG